MEETTKVKYLKGIELYHTDDEIPEDERPFILPLYECTSCHWQFYGNIVRFGYGYKSECKQMPNYCSGCGRKIEEGFAN